MCALSGELLVRAFRVRLTQHPDAGSWRGTVARITWLYGVSNVSGSRYLPPFLAQPTVLPPHPSQVVGLYKKLGFQSDVDGIKGMAYQRKKTGDGKQQGRYQTVSGRR